MLKFAFLGAWHSHAVMHVREAAERPEEFELVGMYDADAEVIKRNQEKWEEYGLDIPVFETIEEVLGARQRLWWLRGMCIRIWIMWSRRSMPESTY